MEKTIKLVGKARNTVLLLTFVSLIVAAFVDPVKYVFLASSVTLYILMILSQTLQNKKMDFFLYTICFAAIIWLFLNTLTDVKFSRAIGMGISYLFLERFSMLQIGKINLFVLIAGSFAICANLINNYIIDDTYFFTVLGRDIHLNSIIGFLIVVTQLIIIFKFLDPILEKIGLAHREKRLAHEAEVAALKAQGIEVESESASRGRKMKDALNELQKNNEKDKVTQNDDEIKK